MLFNSLEFLLFFIVVFMVNHCLRNTFTPRYLFLLAASYYFYASWNSTYLVLILITTAIDYGISLKLEGTASKYMRKILLIISIAVNLGLLGVFKYYNFFLDSAYLFFQSIGVPFQYSSLELFLPIGISFYVFQSISYITDIYFGQQKVERDPVRFALYIAFFPHLVAGPIVRPQDFLPQFNRLYHITYRQFMAGMSLIWLGLAKKVLFADFFAAYADNYFGNVRQANTILDALIGIYSFCFQIYFDFSGYTDTAIGVALLLGFKIPRNFYYPYAALSLSDFWRRWHISLSTWFRDYVYIPQGGNRSKKSRNIMITMILSGLWHGAAWHFIVWGIYHGFLLVTDWIFQKSKRSFLPKMFQRLLVFNLVCAGWVLFRVRDLSDIGFVWSHIVNWAMPSQLTNGKVMALILSFVLYIYYGCVHRWDIKTFMFRQPAWVQTAGHAVILTLLLGLGNFGNPFIYFQF
ncbi:MAG: MBOAT family O-acyltransferase [Nitrospirota bacterium]